MLVLRKISLNNKVTQWLGRQSFEIYLVHGLVIECVSLFFEHKTIALDELFTLFIVFSSVILSVPLKMLFNYVTRITRGERKK